MSKHEVEARRAARAADIAEARDAQETADLEAIDALEAVAGESYKTMTANGFRAGVAVKIAFRAPTAPEYKRYLDQYGRAASKNDAKGRRDAQELLAESCWVYPADKEARASVRDAFPGTLVSLSIEAAKAAELRGEEEGKG